MGGACVRAHVQGAEHRGLRRGWALSGDRAGGRVRRCLGFRKRPGRGTWAREAECRCSRVGLWAHPRVGGRSENAGSLSPEPGLQIEKWTQCFFISIRSLKDGYTWISGHEKIP